MKKENVSACVAVQFHKSDVCIVFSPY